MALGPCARLGACYLHNMKTNPHIEAALANYRAGHYGTPEARVLGATHRCAFWRGYDGVRNTSYVRGSIALAHYQAGKLVRRANPVL